MQQTLIQQLGVMMEAAPTESFSSLFGVQGAALSKS
jgi:hypothetical protein